MDRLFMSKFNRDQAWKSLSKEEKVKHRRRSTRGQLLHPMYVEDYSRETGINLTSQDKGFGNNLYRTYFGVLYSIEEKWY